MRLDASDTVLVSKLFLRCFKTGDRDRDLHAFQCRKVRLAFSNLIKRFAVDDRLQCGGEIVCFEVDERLSRDEGTHIGRL